MQMKIKQSKEIIKKIKKKIYSISFMKSNRYSEKDFTRKRKLPFVSMVLFMLNLVKQTLQKELTHFFQMLSSKKSENITKSAFCQSRLKLKHTAFIELNDVLINEFYTDNIIDTWKGFRLLGVDGSTLQLPNSKSIIDEFGYVKNHSQYIYPTAQGSSCFDILNEIIVDTQISPYDASEYILSLMHLEKTKKNDILLYDRGYGAIWFFYYHILKRRDFVIRIHRDFIPETDQFWESKENSKIIQIMLCPLTSKEQLEKLGLSFKPFKLRLVKVKLDNGEIEVLATSLLDEDKYPTYIFKGLYNYRWGIETNYDHLKNNVEIENFTGLSPLAIKQDFYANAFIVNLQSIIARDVKLEIKNEKKEAKYKYKVNRNLSLGFMKDRVIQILMSDNPKYFDELKALFKMEPIPIRDGRNFPRMYHRSRRKYHMNKKRSI